MFDYFCYYFIRVAKKVSICNLSCVCLRRLSAPCCAIVDSTSWQRADGKPWRGSWQASSKYVAPWIILPCGLMLAWNVPAPWLYASQNRTFARFWIVGFIQC